MLRTILILLFLVFRMSFFAQCPITVDAGPDGFVCGAGQQVTLNGSVTGNYLGFNWSPPAGLDEPQSLTPVATVTGAMTYTLTAFAEDPSAPNLVTNPAFENGNTGFSSNFAFTSSPLSPGTYYITTSPSVVISTFPPCDDHTFGNGTGNMMLVNGTGSPADVWCQSIAVNPNTYYVMNAWAMASPISPPSLQFSINGTLVGNPYNVSGGCNWQQFAASWFSGPATTALFCITDQSGSGNGMFGDDFALDDVYFGEACSVSDDVMVDVVDVQAVTPLLTILECNALPAGIQLDGTGSSAGPFITYEWTTGNGHIISGANTLTPVVDEEGIYTLTVTFDNGSVVCTDVASTEVLPDPDFVLAIAFAPQGIDCTNPTTTIDGGGSSGGAFITYEWTPPAGIVSGGNTPYPIVDMGGTYTLLVTNTESGCTATTQVEVEEDTTQPTAVAGVPGNINCTQPEQTLSGAGSSTGPEFSYLWTAGSGGHIVSGETTLNNCVVDSAGIYQLTVTNDQNGCSAFATLVVEGDLQPPIAIAQANENIDCVNPTVQVSGNGSTTGMGITYEWTTNNGHIVSGEMSLTATVDSGGVYVLTVADAANGCTASDTVVVLENTTLPVAVAAAPAPITCLNDQVSLDGSSSSAGVPYVPVWTTTNGHILSGDSTLSPVVDMAATYLLTVTDTVNGCTATATATVTADIQPPVSEAGQPLTIGCNAAPVSLNGTGSSAGTYLWTTLGGHILSGQSTLMPQVDAAGWYYLTTTNPANGCSATDSVQVTSNGNAPTAMATINGQLDCNTTQLTIDGSGSAAGPDITISWQTSDGHFLSGQSTLQPVVNEGGTYTLTLTDQNSGCTATTSVIVEQDTLLPTIVIAPPPMLNCYYPMDTLDASASSQGAAFTLNWQTPNGHFVFGEMTPAPVIDSPGVYILTIINSVNGCQSVDSVVVAADFTPPIADAGANRMIDCAHPQVALDGSASSGGAAYAYQWTTPDGHFVFGEMTLAPAVDAPGLYALEVTDLENGCTATSEVEVSLDGDFPQVEIALPDVLTCQDTETLLSADAPADPDVIFQWTTANGHIVSGAMTLQPLVDAPGTYLLTATDTTNGCSVVDSVEVFQSTAPPVADAGEPFVLSCGTSSALLNGTTSDTGPAIIYQWTTPDGNITTGAATPSPEINAPGTYILSVSDTFTGCSATDTVVVLQDTDAPVANAGPPDSITCLATLLQLDGSASDSGPEFVYQWTTPNGHIVSGANTLTPTVDAPGTYLLTVTNTANNCQTVASVLIGDATVAPVVSVADSALLTCTDSIVGLPVSASDPHLQYEWTTTNGHFVEGQTTAMPLVDLPATYLLTATDTLTGCSSSAVVVVNRDITPPDAVAFVPGQLGCGQSVLTLDGTGSETGPAITYLWTTPDGHIVSGATTLMPVVDAPGIYQILVTNTESGCTQTATVPVVDNGTGPVIDMAPPDDLTCLQTELTVDASNSTAGLGYQYLWTTAGGHIVSGSMTLTPVVDAPGVYVLTITDTQAGCTATDSVVVLENIMQPQVLAGDDLDLGCAGNEVALQGVVISPSNALLEWGFVPAPGVQGDPFLAGQQTPTPVVNLPGTYVLTATDPANGCTASDSMTLTAGTVLSFSVETTNPGCHSPFGSILFAEVEGGTGPYLFSIDGTNFSSQPFFENLPPGPYTPTVSDRLGCMAGQNVQIADFQSFEIILTASVQTPLGTSVPLHAQVSGPPGAIANIQWTPAEGLSCTDCLTPVAAPLSNTVYLLEVTDTNGCTATATVEVVVAAPAIDVFVPNAFSPNDDGINDLLVVFANQQVVQQVEQFRIFDRWGDAVFEAFQFAPNDFNYGWDGSHRGQRLNAGVFVWLAQVRLVNGETVWLEGEVVLVR